MDFNQKCYMLLSKIPKGKVTTYKEIAKTLNTKAYRAVGKAMSKNPNPIVIPCHRIINTNGSVGGYKLGSNKKEYLSYKSALLDSVQARNQRILTLATTGE